jgi:hypothetical protein
MSESDYQRVVERILESVANPTISTDTGLEAAQQFGEMATREEIEWALAGGIAMHMYGSPRLTKDVDIIASNHLSLTPQHSLSFGGSSYNLQFGKYNVQVDWIVRSDGYRELYRNALKEAIRLPNGLRVVTPEWLAILKFNAGRQKDLDDIVFLLKQEKLVDRSAVKQKVIKTMGEGGWLAMMAGFRRLCDLADGNTKEPGKYYDQD